MPSLNCSVMEISTWVALRVGPSTRTALDAAFGPDDRELLLTRIRAGLREVAVPGQLMACTKQGLDVLLREVNMMRGDFDEKRVASVRFRYAFEVGTAQRAQRLAGNHLLLICRHDKDGDGRIVGRDAADLIEAARVAIALIVEVNPHALEALQRE